jgi:hypothetical protein
MTNHHDDFEPYHASSATDQVLSELRLHGWRPGEDEPDPRPLPEPAMIGGAVADILDALIATLRDTRLEPDLEDLLWSAVNLFHRAADRVQRALDDNEDAQRHSQKVQDGSEIRSVELERLLAQGLTLIERRDSMEFFRDQAAEQFEHHTGSSWRPRAGSMVNHRALTAAMVDSRNFIAAKRRSETEVNLPAGPKVAFTGGIEFNDTQAIWTQLDKARAKHPEMVLLHGGPKAPSVSRPAGRTSATFARSCSSPTGRGTARPRPSSAMTSCSRSFRSASSRFRAQGFPPISPTRQRRSASRSGNSGMAARKRRRSVQIATRRVIRLSRRWPIVAQHPVRQRLKPFPLRGGRRAAVTDRDPLRRHRPIAA